MVLLAARPSGLFSAENRRLRYCTVQESISVSGFKLEELIILLEILLQLYPVNFYAKIPYRILINHNLLQGTALQCCSFAPVT